MTFQLREVEGCTWFSSFVIEKGMFSCRSSKCERGQFVLCGECEVHSAVNRFVVADCFKGELPFGDGYWMWGATNAVNAVVAVPDVRSRWLRPVFVRLASSVCSWMGVMHWFRLRML